MNLSVAVSSNWGIGYKNELLFRISEDLRHFRALTEGKIIVMGHNTLKSLPGGKPLPRRTNIVLSRQKGLEIPGAIVCGSLDELDEILKRNTFSGFERMCGNEDISPASETLSGFGGTRGNQHASPASDTLSGFGGTRGNQHASPASDTLSGFEGMYGNQHASPASETLSGFERMCGSQHVRPASFVIGGEQIYAQLLNRCNVAHITKVNAEPPADAFFPNIDEMPDWQLAEKSSEKFFGEISYNFCKYVRI
ncbi:MAG: dihydrofolate reductase [Defluviitaleaceae bacterium]|nr:dihydrofolate reductase [Defluviitaleaceae bacterium]